MAELSTGGGVRDAAPVSTPASVRDLARIGLALVVLLLVLVGAHLLFDSRDYGARASFSLLIGAALGFVFQRGRFCFFCILRDFIEDRNSTGLFAILAALAVGGIGYAVVFGAFLPNSFSGRLPPDAHIGPVSWVLAAAGVAFGLGMALSGACISGHLYRLGEGYTRAPFALIGSLVGFGLGFFTWQSVYLSAIRAAPVAWLPGTAGYGGALTIHLAALTAIGLVLLRWLPARDPTPAERVTPATIHRALFGGRWNPLATGALVGVIGVAAYFRVEPLGVTSQLGSVSRTVLDNAGLLADRLNGLDGFAGCATVVVQAITENGWLIGGLALASFAAALLSKRFSISRLTLRGTITALGGGVLMGWGSMLALGCTVGTLLSGISAFALSGWVFAAAMFAGVFVGVKLKLHRLD
ncbi:MAG: YeeE/YedE family protein [Chloroflexi bacterium]|nr:YeeE/YedE family protein [Chloroflexota bacterium]